MQPLVLPQQEICWFNFLLSNIFNIENFIENLILYNFIRETDITDNTAMSTGHSERNL